MNKKWTVDWAAFSMQGLIRLKNEDSMVTPEGSLPLVHTDTEIIQGNFYIAKSEEEVIPEEGENHPEISGYRRLAVFDGMGGEEDGEYASYLAAKFLAEPEEESVKTDEVEVGEKEENSAGIYGLCLQMNRQIVSQAKKRRCHMGTTVAGLDFQPEKIISFNVGDSRIYRLADGEFRQLSKDHIPPFSRIHSGCLTQYLGIPETDFRIEPEINSVVYQEGDMYLLCTDGLYKTLNDRRLAAILADDSSLEQKLKGMKELVLKRGAEDNATIILCRIRQTKEGGILIWKN